jgi:hypothetical protein
MDGKKCIPSLTGEATERGPGTHQSAGRADQDPLPRLKELLIEEFEGQREDLIDQAAKHSLERYRGAKVREFVPIFAWRHARRHLRGAS